MPFSLTPLTTFSRKPFPIFIKLPKPIKPKLPCSAYLSIILLIKKIGTWDQIWKQSILWWELLASTQDLGFGLMDLKVLTPNFFSILFLLPERTPKHVSKYFFKKNTLKNYSFLPFPTDWIPSVAPAFSARLFNPQAFSGFGHRGSWRFFCAPYYPWCKVKFAEKTGEVWWP